MPPEDVSHLPELCENESSVTLGQGLLEHLRETGKFAAASGQCAAILEQQGGVVAGLLELRDHGKDQAPALDSLRLFHPADDPPFVYVSYQAVSNLHLFRTPYDNLSLCAG